MDTLIYNNKVFHLKEWMEQFETRKIFSQLKIESERVIKRFANQNMVNLFGVKKVDLETHTLGVDNQR